MLNFFLLFGKEISFLKDEKRREKEHIYIYHVRDGICIYADSFSLSVIVNKTIRLKGDIASLANIRSVALAPCTRVAMGTVANRVASGYKMFW